LIKDYGRRVAVSCEKNRNGEIRRLLSFVAEGIVPTPYLRELEVAKDAGLVELKDTGKFSYEWRLTEKGERIRKRLNSDKNSWRKFQTTLFDFE